MHQYDLAERGQAASAPWPAFASLDALNDRFRAFLERTEHVLGHTAATRMWYRNGVGSFIRFTVATNVAWPLTVDPGTLEGWLAWNRDRGLGAVSLKTYWTALRMFIRAFVEQTGADDPFEKAHTPKLPQHTYKALSPADCERLLMTVRNYPWKSDFESARNAAILGIALYAGLRKREILRLQFLDVDVQDGTIQIRKGKGRNGGKDRTAYIASELTELLTAYLRQRRLHQVTAPEFFVSVRSKRGVGVQVLRELVQKVRGASGVAFSLHVLRHSFVTMLLRTGVPMHIARDLAGHASIQSTEGYARVFREDLKQHIQSIRFST
jgi:site-specific recombinase XerD